MAAKFNVRRAIGSAILLAFIFMTSASAQESFPSDWQYPVPGQPLTAPYGADNSAYGAEKSHTGIDIGTGSKPDAMILAAGDGIVTMVKSGGAGFQGDTVCVYHGTDFSGNPVTTIYAHNRNPLVNVGDVVHKGQEIAQAYGFMPPNGVGFQPHLHFTYQVSETCSYSPSQFRDPMSLPTIVKKWDGGSGGSSTPSGFINTVKEVVVKTAPKAVGPVIGLVIVIVLVMGVSGFKKNPIGSIKQILYLISKVHGYWARRKLLRELNKAREKHGIVRVSLANLLVLGLICAGFYSVQLSDRIGTCEFKAPLGGRIPSRITSTGLDYSGAINELVSATSDGKIVWANWWPSNPDKNLSGENFGQTVVVQTNCGGSSWYVYYGNLSTINVKVGQNISIGDTIGQFGMTGAQQVQMHYSISALGPTETHEASDWENVFTFTATRMVKVVTFWNSLAQFGLKYGGYAILIFALIMFFFTGQSEGIFALIRRSILPGFFFAALVLFAQLGPAIGSLNLTWPRIKIVAQAMTTKDGPCQVSSKFPEGVLRWCNIITTYANQNGLDPNLVAALILQESSGNPDAYSVNGAVGLMQVMPSDGIAAEQFTVFRDRPTVAQLKVADFNVEWGTNYLGNLNKAKGSIRDSLKSYGPAGVDYYYADIVLGLYNTYK